MRGWLANTRFGMVSISILRFLSQSAGEIAAFHSSEKNREVAPFLCCCKAYKQRKDDVL